MQRGKKACKEIFWFGGRGVRYKIYLKDWYYNSGIIGFLRVLSENERNIDKIKEKFNGSINIGANYLEFESGLLESFFEKYKKLAFDMFFDIENYKGRIDNLITKIQQPNVKLTKKLLEETALKGKIVNEFINIIYGRDLNEIFSNNEIVKEVQNIQEKLRGFLSNFDVYNYLLANKKDSFIDTFLVNEVEKRICYYKNIEKYLKDLSVEKQLFPKKNDQRCYICGEFKKSYDLSNAITQVVGFNADNSNWVWGFETSKVKICPLCALIYSSALQGMVFMKRNIDKEQKTFFYFLNRNTDISTLYNSYWIFREKIDQKENQNKPFYTILQEVTIELINQQASAILENINFVEVSESQLGGQSTKSYNVYNYNITKELAEFIKSRGREKIPRGYYKDKDNYYDITEEILKKTLSYTINISDLSKYFDLFINSLDPKSKIIIRFSIYKLTEYILTYIWKLKGGDKMIQEQIVNKAFHNGKILGQKIDQENKIKGIAYQLLNDLKINNRDSFVDKYLRLCMAYGTEVKLGSNNELTDIDNFMNFGYAFVNGLLSTIKKEDEEVKNG